MSTIFNNHWKTIMGNLDRFAERRNAERNGRKAEQIRTRLVGECLAAGKAGNHALAQKKLNAVVAATRVAEENWDRVYGDRKVGVK